MSFRRLSLSVFFVVTLLGDPKKLEKGDMMDSSALVGPTSWPLNRLRVDVKYVAK